MNFFAVFGHLALCDNSIFAYIYYIVSVKSAYPSLHCVCMRVNETHSAVIRDKST